MHTLLSNGIISRHIMGALRASERGWFTSEQAVYFFLVMSLEERIKKGNPVVLHVKNFVMILRHKISAKLPVYNFNY